MTNAHIGATLLSMLGGVVIPLLVGLLAKAQAPAGLKAILNAGLSAAAGAVATAIAAGGGDWKLYVFNIGLTWALSIATHYGLWKPTGLSDTIQGVTGGFGVGPSS